MKLLHGVEVLLLWCTIGICMGAPNLHELLPYEPTAHRDAVVVSGNARFTVLTDRLIRMEYAANGTFEDRATVAFVNRALPVPEFTAHSQDGRLTISTATLELTYKVGQPFSAASLRVAGPSFTWAYGQTDARNLLGTIKSLDRLGAAPLNCTLNKDIIVHDEGLHCAWGLVSRAGYAVVEDHDNYALSNKDGWWDGVNKDDIDVYLFGHGHAYTDALADFVKVGGRPAMVPRAAHGVWWTRWFNYNNADLEKIVDDYASRSIPLDVFVLDMDWHTKDGWGGYSFDRRLFPFPDDALGALKAKGLYLAANLHDDDGVRPTEDKHAEMARAMGLDPAKCGTIPVSFVNSSYLLALEDIVLKAVEDDGMDFWWIDWQQGGKQGGCAGGKQNPTIWTNRIRATDHIRRGESERGMVLARWGGLGSHRYQTGFSGDIQGVTWQNLAYQPYFTLTAANVAYGYWSHDTVGPANDFELYTRWVQWSAHSGVMRSHDRGMSAGDCADKDPATCSVVKIWEAPVPYFEAMRSAMQWRERMIPYIYTSARAAYDTGVGLIRPMYYYYPENDEAYAASPDGTFAQYFFGPDIIVAPVVTAADRTSLAPKKVWLPEGNWVDDVTGEEHFAVPKGGKVITKSYDLGEVPRFVRGGAIIATRPTTDAFVAQAREPYNELEFTMYPGKKDGTTLVYEDDGTTTAYVTAKSATTSASFTIGDDLSFSWNTEGAFPELPTQRSVTLRVVNAYPPAKVTVNKDELPFSRFGGPRTWHYDGLNAQLVVETGTTAVGVANTIHVTFAETKAPPPMSGLKGAFSHALLAKATFDEARVTPGAHSVEGGQLSTAASVGATLSRLASSPADFSEQVAGFKAQYQSAIAEVKSMEGAKGVTTARWERATALLASVLL